MGSNIMIEASTSAVAGGVRRTSAYYSNSMILRVMENYGQLKVIDRETKKPLSRVYVKVYWRGQFSSSSKFYKDGYTDCRGRFDYVAISTDELSQVKRFAILVTSEKNGAVVCEARPPA